MEGKFYAALDYEQLEARVAELEATCLKHGQGWAALDRRLGQHRYADDMTVIEATLARIAKLEAALRDIAESSGEEVCADGYSAAWHARKALEKGSNDGE